HTLAIRTKDADGKWGFFETQRFFISSPSSADVANIVAAEYFIDADPGAGSGTPLTVGTPGATVNLTAAIPTSLPVGFHTLAIRTKDANGNWGIFETARFFVSPPAVPDVSIITAAEYFFDTDPGTGNGFAL